MHILVTGAAGFVGLNLLKILRSCGHRVTAICRVGDIDNSFADRIEDIKITKDTQWQEIISGVDAVIHLADGLRQFEGQRTIKNPQHENDVIDATVNLAHSARIAGVRTFVYLSSIKAIAGEMSDTLLTEASEPSATRPIYGVMKLRLEVALNELSEGSSMKVVTLRSPIVYGTNGKGNFLKLIKFSDTPWPLPFANRRDKRSIIAVDNLCDCLLVAAQNKPGNSGAYFVHDGSPLSVTQLFMSLRQHLSRQARLFPCPQVLFSLLEYLPPLRPVVMRLTKSLELSDEKFRTEFSWSPPLTTQAALKAVVDDYKKLK